jgi:hypothetical protein
LKKVISKRGPTVEEASGQDKAIEEVQKWPDERRETIPHSVSQPPFPVRLFAPQRRLDFAALAARSSLEQLPRLKCCVDIVFGYPVVDIFPILVDEITIQSAYCALDDNMFVDCPVFATTFPAPKQPKDPGRIISATDPAAHPKEASVQEKPIFCWVRRYQPRYFCFDGLWQPFIGIEK